MSVIDIMGIIGCVCSVLSLIISLLTLGITYSIKQTINFSNTNEKSIRTVGQKGNNGIIG